MDFGAGPLADMSSDESIGSSTQPLSAKLVFQKINTYLQESLKNNGNKQAQFLHLLTPSQIAVLNFMGMELVEDEDLKELYDKVEEERKEKFGDDFVMPFTRDDMPLMNYTTAALNGAFLYGYVLTEDTSARAMETAVASMRAKQAGRVALKKYDAKVIDCVKALFVITEPARIKAEYKAVKLEGVTRETIRDQLMKFAANVNEVSETVDTTYMSKDGMDDILKMLTQKIEKYAPSLATRITNLTLNQEFSISQWAKVMMQELKKAQRDGEALGDVGSALQVENDELRKEVARLKALTAGVAAPATVTAKNQCQNCGKWGQHTAKDCTFKEGGQAAAHPAGKGHGGGKGSTGGKGQGKGTVRAVAAATKGLGNWLTPAQRAILQETAAQMAKSNQQGYEQD